MFLTEVAGYNTDFDDFVNLIFDAFASIFFCSKGTLIMFFCFGALTVDDKPDVKGLLLFELELSIVAWTLGLAVFLAELQF